MQPRFRYIQIFIDSKFLSNKIKFDLNVEDVNAMCFSIIS